MSEVKVLRTIDHSEQVFRPVPSFWWLLTILDILWLCVHYPILPLFFSWWIGTFHFNEIQFVSFYIRTGTFCALQNKQLLIPSSQMYYLENSKFLSFIVKPVMQFYLFSCKMIWNLRYFCSVWIFDFWAWIIFKHLCIMTFSVAPIISFDCLKMILFLSYWTFPVLSWWINKP